MTISKFSKRPDFSISPPAESTCVFLLCGRGCYWVLFEKEFCISAVLLWPSFFEFCLAGALAFRGLVN